MSKPTPVVSKITPVESKPTLVQHKLQLAIRTSEPVVQIGEIILQEHKSEQQTHQPALTGSQYHNRNGKLLNLFPVAAKMAFANAGATGGTPGSPAPPIFSPPGTIYTSMTGVSFIRSIR